MASKRADQFVPGDFVETGTGEFVVAEAEVVPADSGAFVIGWKPTTTRVVRVKSTQGYTYLFADDWDAYLPVRCNCLRVGRCGFNPAVTV